MKDTSGKQITTCAKRTCTKVADAQRGVNDRNGEVLCPRHGEEHLARRR
jgi:hypothetical protein